MKHITAILITLLLVANLHAQDQEAIKQAVSKYYDIMQSKDLIKTLDHTYPKLFDIVPRKDLEKALGQTFSDTTLELSFNNFVVSKISNSTVKHNVKYALVSYSFNMQIKILEAQDDSYYKLLLETYQDMFGKKLVTYDKQSHTYTITRNSTMFAINDPDYAGWKFLENKKEMVSLLSQMIPADVMKALNK